MVYGELIQKQSVEEFGYEILDILESKGSRDMLIRVTIDRLDQQPITVDDCAKVSKLIERQLEGHATRKQYTLEVSSPGINRPLTIPRHFINAIGKNVKLKIGTEETKSLEGELVSADENEITVKAVGVDVPLTIGYNQIRKANINFLKKRSS